VLPLEIAHSEDLVTESMPADDPGTQKRRSTRIVQAVPITVTGVDALGQPFKERTTTVMVNCHGCKYQSKHYVPKNSMVTLDIPRPEPSMPPHSVQGRVVWVQRPRTVRELFQIGLEFDVPGNTWGIAFPPEDWLAISNEEEVLRLTNAVAVPGAAESKSAIQTDPVPDGPSTAVPAAKAEAPTAEAATPPIPPVIPPPTAPAAPAAAIPSAESKIHVVPAPVPSEDTQLAVAKNMAKMVADAKEQLEKTLKRGAESAITEEMTVVRQQLDAQLHDAVEKAIKTSMDRVSESAAKKVVQQAADRTAAIVEEARKANQESVGQLDAKVRKAVQEAVSQAANDGAQQAAQQASAQNLKQAVEEAVDHALTAREASTPSLEILSSPEAAQQHLDQWRKNLEETAQGVRSSAIEQTTAEGTAATQRWREEFENTVSGASQKIGDKLNEAAQAALAQAEQDAAERNLKLRASADEVFAAAQLSINSLGTSLQQERARAEETKAQLQGAAEATVEATRKQLDEAIAGAQSAINSLGTGLEQERARAEETKSQLQSATDATIEQARQRLDQILTSKSDDAARRADEVLAERVQKLEPQIEASAGKIVVRISSELEEKLAPKLEQVQQVLSELAMAEQQATHLHDAVREQVQEVSQQAINASLEQLRQETANLPAEVEKSTREVVAKFEEEIQARSTETQHAAYESLLKASDWYQKKAQTTMHSTMEKAVEQSTTALRDRAAEISSLLASELDHYRRTYVEHSQGQIEDAAKEVVDRERTKLGETADMTRATFTDRIEKATGESLRRFEDSSREALEKARSDMEYNREGSLLEFQKKLDEKLVTGVEQARTHLMSQVGPLMEAWEEKREAEQRAWIEALKKSTDESIEQYKGRLENASNSWLLASATTLGQSSQAVIDALAKTAEKRIRETCAQVLAGMGDTLKDKLIGISTHFNDEEEDDQTPPKKS
jgi:DNA repair exonuclease SbcCD ATPase subunit